MTLEEWNERYRAGGELDHEPASLLVQFASSLTPGRALDLACGAGRNAAWLAERGWDVVAIDGASEAISLVPSGIETMLMDLEQGAPLPFENESFDLVLILFYLHRPLFAEAKRVLHRGGLLMTTALTRGRYGVRPGELCTHFEGWEIVHEREAEVAELVVRRP